MTYEISKINTFSTLLTRENRFEKINLLYPLWISQCDRPLLLHFFETMFRAAQQRTSRAAVQYTQRRLGHGTPPAENPVFKAEDQNIFSASTYSHHPPNSDYGTMFAHPMNYQGEVPVTPSRFQVYNDLGQLKVNPRVHASFVSTTILGTAMATIGFYHGIQFSADMWQRAGGVCVPLAGKRDLYDFLYDYIGMQPNQEKYMQSIEDEQIAMNHKSTPNFVSR